MAGNTIFVLLALTGAAVAAGVAVACAIACTLLARRIEPLPPAPRFAPPPQQPMQVVHVPAAPASFAAPEPHGAPMSHGVVELPRAPLVLGGHYPALGRTLGGWMQAEGDAIERVRIAQDLGTVGDADSARALLDGVRTGVITPTVAAANLERGSWAAGVAIAAALQDPAPRVRALASTLAGRAAPLRELPPLPAVPNRPGAPDRSSPGR